VKSRYQKQLLLSEIGEAGQARLAEATCAVIGCGALGSGIAEMLARAGAGTLVLADRDFVEEVNLHRQILFDEEDAAERRPKAMAARDRLGRINSTINIESHVIDVGPRNIEALIEDATVVLDGTDNLETRYLINDACVKHHKPWVYGGAVGVNGLVMSIIPGKSPCLRCALEDPPPPNSIPTCDTSGVLGTAPVAVAALQATQAIKLIVGDRDHVGQMTSIDLWQGTISRMTLERNDACPACVEGRYEFLSAEKLPWVTTLCGRCAVQITPPGNPEIDLEALGESLSKVGNVRYNGVILTLEVGDLELNLFPDARAIIKGTADEAVARGLYARYVGV
jgi:molybdopterin/thiamine biosynthesis adenylyltransferase